MESMMVKPVFLILLGCVLQAQAASDSTFITFNGTVLANTCTLSTGSRDQIMVLGSIADRDIKGKGTTGGEKEVNMVLRDCGASATAVVVSVQGEADNDDALAFRNALPESEGGAAGVGLYFYQTDGKTQFSPDGSVTQISALTPSADNTLIYKAAYAGTKDSVVAGKFSTVVNVNFEYQ
ncbi:TPA: type 1 fimbrial protein [Salmonella enterica]|nr:MULTISPECIES: fimbrial protein [Enterobacteriaceae]EKL4397403.1 type 1 fimbrial protein [Salmonella enterica]EKY1903419.1 type 1 fimbrial protein [Cronobacter sakazakii]HBZ8161658.1 type 1 fimbrial protein [Escherichia coli]HCA3481686.1 type 1 fimbrial protein [Salmonella enterica subsp. enterica serovar Java]HCC0035564.1 type 1 fimbrial protein [Salmonella enterica subsp. enterica serovar Paratyphi B]HCQ0109802.1 type 1 fimbrial protein [Citrobacter braakii]